MTTQKPTKWLWIVFVIALLPIVYVGSFMPIFYVLNHTGYRAKMDMDDWDGRAWSVYNMPLFYAGTYGPKSVRNAIDDYSRFVDKL